MPMHVRNVKCSLYIQLQSLLNHPSKATIIETVNLIVKHVYSHNVSGLVSFVTVMGKSKLWLNHTCWFDLTAIFDLEKYDLIWIWFQFMWFDLWFQQIISLINMGRSESNAVLYTIFADRWQCICEHNSEKYRFMFIFYTFSQAGKIYHTLSTSPNATLKKWNITFHTCLLYSLLDTSSTLWNTTFIKCR